MANKRILFLFLTIVVVHHAFSQNREFVLMSGGTIERRDNDGRKQTVFLGPFLIATRQIIVREWEEYLDSISSNNIQMWKRKMLYEVDSEYVANRTVLSENWPVFCITWYEIIRYCNWLSTKDGLAPVYLLSENEKGEITSVAWDKNANGYRLPTEAESEFASGVSSANAREEDYLRNTWVGIPGKRGTAPHDVMLKPPNKYGLYDCFGIVFEYCWDLYNETYYLSQDIINPSGPDVFFDKYAEGHNEEIRAARGGGWYKLSVDYLKYPRSYGYAHWNNGMIGFRLAKNVPQSVDDAK